MYKKVLLLALFACLAVSTSIESKVKAKAKDGDLTLDDIKEFAAGADSLYGVSLVTFTDSTGNSVQVWFNEDSAKRGYFIYCWVDSSDVVHGAHLAYQRFDNVLDTFPALYAGAIGDDLYPALGELLSAAGLEENQDE